ncbi:hypothetical protein [Aliarcobacter cryaerophilus]|uniref:Uncharacterized protein n=1 Tax=Aliarcobacter cryaerophilus TaxID=28198 RepID=A0A2S9SPY5_9BACT|nr:hypothetical protein [Aliarcobacter cryaerophilus]PRM88651.1 hypothetical protein CJ669_03200 [Aliarcobacter cryaerophilus]
MANVKNTYRDLISTLPQTINQKLIVNYRVKLFGKVKDSLEKNKSSLQKDEFEFKEWLRDTTILNINCKAINNNFYTPNLGA